MIEKRVFWFLIVKMFAYGFFAIFFGGLYAMKGLEFNSRIYLITLFSFVVVPIFLLIFNAYFANEYYNNNYIDINSLLIFYIVEFFVIFFMFFYWN